MRTIRDCNVAVVGGAGFLGSHLVDHLIEDRGCRVLVIDNLQVGRLEFVHEDAQFEYHDIAGSESRLRRIVEGFKTKFLFNYAAMPYVPDSYARPLRVFEVNATGAMQVINAAQEAGVEAILQVSSAELYGDGNVMGDFDNPEHVSPKLAEDAPVCPHSSYGAAKAAVDYFCQCAWKERQTPVIALRQFNCVGERETHPYVVPEIISQLTKQLPHPLSRVEGGLSCKKLAPVYATVQLGNNSFRDFLYAGDAVKIAVELLERGQLGEVYNLGSETGIKIYDLAKMIGEVMGFKDVKVERDESRVRPWEIWALLSSNDKLYSAVGRRPLISLRDALRKTVSWYESVGRKWPWEQQSYA